jgi:hypothetical protein
MLDGDGERCWGETQKGFIECLLMAMSSVLPPPVACILLCMGVAVHWGLGVYKAIQPLFPLPSLVLD